MVLEGRDEMPNDLARHALLALSVDVLADHQELNRTMYYARDTLFIIKPERMNLQ